MKREWAIFAAQAFAYFVFIKIADWILRGVVNDLFGMTPRADHVRLAVYAVAVVGFAIWGVARLRDRFSVLVALALIAVPLATWALGAMN